MNSPKKSNSWEDELKTKWYLHHCEIQCLAVPDKFTTCEEEVIEFIKALLKEQRENCANVLIELDVSDDKYDRLYQEVFTAPEPRREK